MLIWRSQHIMQEQIADEPSVEGIEEGSTSCDGAHQAISTTRC